MPETLHIAVCLSDEVTLSDFIPPMEILAMLNIPDHPSLGALFSGLEIPYRVKVDYLAPTRNPIVSNHGLALPTLNPTMTYEEATESKKQFDVIWVPAGPVLDVNTGATRIPQEETDFIKQQAPGAKYVLSVCGGAHQLALAGVLSGKRATTNKQLFRIIERFTPKDIQWIPKARWVVDGKVWTSSGVSAGSDMALAFVEHLVGPDIARVIRGGVEVPEVTDMDDPFAQFHGLV